MKTTEQKIKTKKEELEKLENQLQEEQDKSEWIKIPGTNLEITKDVIHKGKSYNEIIKLKKPEEDLVTLKIIGIISENPSLLKLLKMDSSSTNDDFFFKQPFPQNEKRDYVARCYAGSGYADLDCGEDSSVSGSYLGVRFVRKSKESKK